MGLLLNEPERYGRRRCPSTPPTLAFPNFSLPFIHYVDASHNGMAACLHQPFHADSDLPLVSSAVRSMGRREPPMYHGPPVASAHANFSFDFDVDEMNVLRSDLRKDKVFSNTYKRLLAGQMDDTFHSVPAGISDRFELVNGILYWPLRDGRLVLCLPDTLIPRVLRAAHDSAGYWGFGKTWSIMKDRFFCPGLSSDVLQYVLRCPDCQRVKPSRQYSLGSMSPYELATTAFQTVSMDIILGLPSLRRDTLVLDACMVIVAQFSKGVILRPLFSSADAQTCGFVFFDDLVSCGFLPSKLITDRDPKFFSIFWATLMKQLKIDCKL